MPTADDIVLSIDDLPTILFRAAGVLNYRNAPRRGDKISVGGCGNARVWFKRFIKTVPGFKENPVFTVKGGKLVYQDRDKLVYMGSEKFTLEPSFLGLDPKTLTEGQRVRINLVRS